jgi:hypothetical protein
MWSGFGTFFSSHECGCLKKTSGRFRDKGQRLLFCKGVASHTAQETSTRIAHRKSRSSSGNKPFRCLPKEETRIAAASLTWIRQHYCLNFQINVKGVRRAAPLLETKRALPT